MPTSRSSIDRRLEDRKEIERRGMVMVGYVVLSWLFFVLITLIGLLGWDGDIAVLTAPGWLLAALVIGGLGLWNRSLGLLLFAGLSLGAAAGVFAASSLIPPQNPLYHVALLGVHVGFCLLALSAVVITYRNRPRSRPCWYCQACGYPVYGAGGEVCPECGERFDAEHVRRKVSV